MFVVLKLTSDIRHTHCYMVRSGCRSAGCRSITPPPANLDSCSVWYFLCDGRGQEPATNRRSKFLECRIFWFSVPIRPPPPTPESVRIILVPSVDGASPLEPADSQSQALLTISTVLVLPFLLSFLRALYALRQLISSPRRPRDTLSLITLCVLVNKVRDSNSNHSQ
jgi:hypothetical protein